jgi:hypothetical protein
MPRLTRDFEDEPRAGFRSQANPDGEVAAGVMLPCLGAIGNDQWAFDS